MPTNRQRRRPARREGTVLTAEVRMILETGSDMLGSFRELTPVELERKLRELWELHGPEVLRDFVVKNPGKRPECWWMFSAPERRPVAPHSGGNFVTWAKHQEQLWIAEIAVLVRHKLLTREEEAALKAKAAVH